jgi:NitT/TauT family transport system substrate-binding protein
MIKRFATIGAGLLALGIAFGSTASAQAVKEISITRQPGVLYLPAQVMEKQKLLEKHAATLGITDLKVNWVVFTSGGAATDALLSDNVHIVNSGLGNMLLLWDRTRGGVKGIITHSAQPVTLISRDPKIKTIKDFGPTDKIAVPTIKVSTQAILLQMAAAQTFGPEEWAKLDGNTVQLGHPDAAAALANPSHEVASHFAAPPFDFRELKTVPGAHIVLRSQDVIGGPLSQSTLFTTTKFADANPKIIEALMNASKEAVAYVLANIDTSLEIYKEVTGDKTPIEDLKELMKQPGMMAYQTNPAGSMKFATHMQKAGVLKTKPAAWTDYFLPSSASLNGN